MKVSGQCRLCQFLVDHQLSPKNYTMCYANSSWQEAADSSVAKVLDGVEKLPSMTPSALVALSNNHWWPSAFGQNWEELCHSRGQPIDCRYVNIHSSNPNLTSDERQQLASKADALLYYTCPDGPRPLGANPNTPVVAMAAQGHANSSCMNKADIMGKVQIEMSYKSCSQVRGMATCGE
jgi:hypothetical protein